jgi:hypothetical protein
MNRLERMFTPRVALAIKTQISSFIKDIREGGVDYAKRRINDQLINTRASEVIREIYLVVGSYFARQTIKEINGLVREEKGFGINPEWIAELTNYFRSDLLTKAVFPVSETTRRQIMDILTKAQTEGWGVERIIKELNSDELLIWRARMIVRTEVTRSMFYGQKIGEKESKWESTKRWIAADDHRTRHSHNNVDDAVVDAEGKFAVPIYKRLGKVDLQIGFDMMEGPGDPRATAGNVINCRCTISRRLKKDENGRLIRKNPANVGIGSM